MKKLFLVFVCFCLQMFAGQEPPNRKTVCLNMIVKDESPVIRRCLASVKGLIDYWVIVDTGSTDGTQEVIREFMKDVPGELYERPWINFAHNRNEALQLAKDKADYLLIIDADEQLLFDENFVKPSWDKDFYYVTVLDTTVSFQRVHLVNAKLNWSWVGVLHEMLVCSEARTSDLLKGVQNSARARDGHRCQDPLKYKRDADLLEAALKDDPNNSRYVFYLAQSYFNIQDYEASLRNYERRALMGGWDEEVFFSHYMAGRLKQALSRPFEDIVKSYKAAYLARNIRAEPLFRLGCLYLKNQDYVLAYPLLKMAASMPRPEKDLLFVEQEVYDYAAAFEAANSAALLGKDEEALKGYTKLVECKNFPEQLRKDLTNNIVFVTTPKEKRVVAVR